MPWAKLDDRFHENRKIRRVWRRQPVAIGLHVMAITYCAGHLTDGLVDTEFVEDRLPVARMRERAVQALVDAELWHVADGGWQIHDFTDFNMSRASVDERRAGKAEAGRQGGLQKHRNERIDQAMKRAIADRYGVPERGTKTISCAYCETPIVVSRDERDRVRFLDLQGNATPEIDHVKSLASGGPHEVENLVPACMSCNRSKGAGSADPGTVLAAAREVSSPRPVPSRPVQDADASSRRSRDEVERDKASIDDRRLCRLFAELGRANNPKLKIGADAAWLRSMRLMREQDGHAAGEIERAISWLFSNSSEDAQFWASTVQSPAGLRKHFGQLWGRMHKPTRPPAQAGEISDLDRKRLAGMQRAMSKGKAAA